MVEKLNKDMIEAMKSKDKDRLVVIRMVKAALKQEQIDHKKEINDDLLIDVVNKQIKMRKDSITEFEKGNRTDLVEKTQKEIDVLMAYLPEQLSKEEVEKIIKRCTIVMWILEVIMITFKISTGDAKNLNNYVPLYYCSLLLYAGLLSSFGKNKLERMGNVFLATGGIIGGVVFMILPTTSLPSYPMFHLVSIHSYIFHGVMVYLGLLINLTHYIEIEKNDNTKI